MALDFEKCDHVNRLPPDYPGRFCLYCGRQVAELSVDEGQLQLESHRGRQYLALIHKGQQKAVETVVADPGCYRIWFRGEPKEATLTSSALIRALQDPQELLKLEEGEQPA